jgi:hypothetical protein
MWEFAKRAASAAWGLGKQYLTSKKAVATLAGIVLVVGKSLGVSLPEDEVTKIIALLAAYIVGQGIADAGKSKAQLITEAKDTLVLTEANKAKLADLLNAAPDTE